MENTEELCIGEKTKKIFSKICACVCAVVMFFSCFVSVNVYYASETSLERVKAAINNAGGDDSFYDLRSDYNYVIYGCPGNNIFCIMGVPKESSVVISFIRDEPDSLFSFMTPAYFDSFLDESIDYYDSAYDGDLYYAWTMYSKISDGRYIEVVLDYENPYEFGTSAQWCNTSTVELIYSDLDIPEVSAEYYDEPTVAGKLFYDSPYDGVAEPDAEPDLGLELEYLEQIATDLRVILAFTIITFCTSCFRSWRINVTGGKR